MAGSSSAALARKKFKQEFAASGNFTVPVGVTEVFVTMVGGGGGGPVRQVSYNTDSLRYNIITAHRGGSGFYLVNHPVLVTPGSVIPVVIGAGGAAVTTSGSAANALDGGATSFGSLIVKGGSGGKYNAKQNDPDTTPPSVSLTDGGIAYSTWDGKHSAIKQGVWPAAPVSLDFDNTAVPSVLNTAPLPHIGNYGAGGYATTWTSNAGAAMSSRTSGPGEPGFVLVEWYA